VSRGRLIFGLGAGYLEPEFRALGAPFEDRGAVTDEAIEAIKALWTMGKPAYKGRFFSFEGIDAQPRPVQKPHPPIVAGGMSRSGARRAARYAYPSSLLDASCVGGCDNSQWCGSISSHESPRLIIVVVERAPKCFRHISQKSCACDK
jgi:hypothetical protein